MTSEGAEAATALPLTENMLKLVTVGRTTGLPHIATMRFDFAGGSFYVLAGRRRSDWALNALAAGWAKVRLGTYVYTTRATRASDEEMSTTLESFSRKYGRAFTRDWYGSAWVCVRLTPEGVPSQRGGVRGEGDVKIDLAQWKRRRPQNSSSYYEGVAEAFDSASEEYDYTISHNFINVWIRTRSIAELRRFSRPEDSLLEIGCGTGAEAIEISKHVRKVVATDISPRMIELLRLKTKARGLQQRVVPLELRASKIAAAAPYLPGGRTRVAYSFNGALNCEPEIDAFPAELAKVVEEDGFFVCSIRNTICMSEVITHGLVLQFAKMAPRKRQPIMVSVGGLDIPSYYYPPARFAKFFAPQFRLVRMIGLPSILPPAYLSDVYFKARKILSFAETMERGLASRFPFNRFGDQTLFVFQKRRGSATAATTAGIER